MNSLGKGKWQCARWARDVSPRPVQWSLAHRIPRGVASLLAAPRDMGKTLASIWHAAEVNRVGGIAWINSVEDDLQSVVRPRCEVAGAAMDRTRLSAIRFRFPRAFDRFVEEIRVHRAAGLPDDLIILDALQGHLPKYGEKATEALEGLSAIAAEFEVAILLVAHFIKGQARTVQQAIGGDSTIQNIAKAIFVLGPEPRSADDRIAAMLGEEEPLPRRILACERLGVGPHCESLLFELDTRRYEATDRGEPFLRLVGPTPVTALQVLEALRKEAAGPGPDESKQTQAAAWMVATLAASGPMPTRRLERLAKEAGTYFSTNTFDRARKLALVEAIHPSRLKDVLGAQVFAALPESDRQVHWVRSGWSGAPISSSASMGDSPIPPSIPAAESPGE